MKVKVGDTVRIIAGKDKGKESKVIKTLKSENRVVVEGINIVKRHTKPRTTEDKGGIIEIESPIHVSNVKKVNVETKEVAKEKKTTTKKTVSKKESK